tara:strand:+ start:323531 stop:325717 length:2187 start_codon:yes stop_codon:yes gene_type:complete
MFKRFTPTPIAFAAFLTVCGAHAQETPKVDDQKLGTITVNASADASADGLSKPYAGGQVARGGRAGILGTQDNLDVPFNITSYTNELIQDQQARTIGDVLKNDSSVRVARGFGNFQESYFIRGFILASDEVAYNGLYSILPRQSIATELVERVEVLRGASAFLTGAAPGGGGIGGSINLLPKRAPNNPLTRITVGGGTGGQTRAAADVARRFGPDASTGIRVNAVHGEGGTGVDREKTTLDAFAIGVDWHSSNVRLSGDIGYQNNRLKRARPSVTIDGGSVVPDAPDNTKNWSQNWTHSNERDTFGTLRGEYDFNANWTAWAAFGMRQSKESNVLSGLTITSAATGDGTGTRFDNNREDTVKSGEVGLRGKLKTGSISHSIVASASTYRIKEKGAYRGAEFAVNDQLNNPQQYSIPSLSYSAGDMGDPLTVSRNQLDSFAVGDTIGFAEDQFLVTVGARHQTIDTSSFDYVTGALKPDDSYKRSHVSPVVGLVWKMKDNLSLYANYIESLSRALTAPNDPTKVDNPGQVFDPYVSKQKEVGVKYDGSSIGGAVAYFTTIKPSGVTENRIYKIDGEDRHQGIELSVYGKATRDLKILGGITLLDAEIRKTANGQNDGNRVIGVPKAQANLGLEWRVPGIQGLSLDSQIVATGSSYANNTNTLKVAGWTRLDLGARYMTEVSGKILTLRANIDNVTDRDYWASVGGNGGSSGYLAAGMPRTITVSASLDF